MATQGVLHFATKDFEVKKNGVFSVPASKLILLDGFNDREDYGDVNELAESIYHVGPKVPLKGYKEGEKYVVIVGHRRFRAAEMIKKKYGKDVVFQMTMYSPGSTKADMLLDTLLTNSGKDLTPLEKASAVSKLIDHKTPVKAIAEALGGVSTTYIKNLQKLWGIPELAKDLIRSNIVSASTVMGYLKAPGANMEEWIQEVIKQAGIEDEAAGGKKGRKKKTAKVTAKNAPGKRKNSLKEFKKFRKANPKDSFDNQGKREAFEFVCKLQDNKLTLVEIEEFFIGEIAK